MVTTMPLPFETLWTIRPRDRDGTVEILDQTRLPHECVTVTLRTVDDVAHAIRIMQVRGAPLIGVATAWGVALAVGSDPTDHGLAQAGEVLLASRPTAVNLRWAIERMAASLRPLPEARRARAAWDLAATLTAEDATTNATIGEHGARLIEGLAADRNRDGAFQILTHCNAGWLATTAWGTATAPIYRCHAQGLPLHVWVSETRPRNQGASLTAWELGQAGIPHTVVADNAAGHLMRTGRIDICLVGADRVAANGDVVNKIGTYLKALAARDTRTPFHVAFPASTIDWRLASGDGAPIEDRDPSEVGRVRGRHGTAVVEVDVLPDGSAAANPAFDVTPASLIDGFITEHGRCAANAEGLRSCIPEVA